MIYVGIDDTDNKEGGGTGRLAREVAAELRDRYPVFGVTRHQLLVDPRVPYTSNNSCNVIHVQTDELDRAALSDWVCALVLARALPGSDPGICVGDDWARGHPFGERAQTQFVEQTEAILTAHEVDAQLRGVGGTEDGIIGAMAGVILAAGGDDGRFVEVGHSRRLQGIVNVNDLLATGVHSVVTRDGAVVAGGFIDTNEGRVRPVLRDNRAVLLVEATAVGAWKVIEQGKGGHKQRQERR